MPKYLSGFGALLTLRKPPNHCFFYARQLGLVKRFDLLKLIFLPETLQNFLSSTFNFLLENTGFEKNKAVINEQKMDNRGLFLLIFIPCVDTIIEATMCRQ